MFPFNWCLFPIFAWLLPHLEELIRSQTLGHGSVSSGRDTVSSETEDSRSNRGYFSDAPWTVAHTTPLFINFWFCRTLVISATKENLQMLAFTYGFSQRGFFMLEVNVNVLYSTRHVFALLLCTWQRQGLDGTLGWLFQTEFTRWHPFWVICEADVTSDFVPRFRYLFWSVSSGLVSW